MLENNPFYNKSHSMDAKLRMIEANSASALPLFIFIIHLKIY